MRSPHASTRYNEQREHIWEYERQGRALVIAPRRPVEVGHIEHDSPSCSIFISKGGSRPRVNSRRSAPSSAFGLHGPMKGLDPHGPICLVAAPVQNFCSGGVCAFVRLTFVRAVLLTGYFTEPRENSVKTVLYMEEKGDFEINSLRQAGVRLPATGSSSMLRGALAVWPPGSL